MSARFESGELRRLLGLPPVQDSRTFTSVSTDTRGLEPGALFIALRGERFDGADFLAEAARLGALGAIVPEGRPLPEADLEWFPVPDTTVALGQLALHRRAASGARVVGITGSSGKTTVKEMVKLAVSGSYRVHATRGNLNNRIGLPLSVLAAPVDADVWILEVGTSRPGEVAELTRIAAPDDGVVTTVGPAHLEGFGDIEGVLEEKLDLVRGASPEGLIVVGELPADLPRAAREARPDARIVGLGPGSDYRPEAWDLGPNSLEFRIAGTTCRLSVGGEHHLRDALIAAAVAEGLGVPFAEAAGRLSRFRPLGMRSSVWKAGELVVIADCYNANPESFGAVIRYCASSFSDRRLTAVVGTMLELGRHSDSAHREVARQLVDAGFQLIVALGEFGPAFRALGPVRNGTTVACADTPNEVWQTLRDELKGDEVVLVKASRGVHLETVVDRLAAEFGTGES